MCCEFERGVIIHSRDPEFVETGRWDVKDRVYISSVGKINVIGIFVRWRIAEVNAGTNFWSEFCRALVRFEGDVYGASPDAKMRNVWLFFC